MPSRIQIHENLWFLFICLEMSDYKIIDFNAVGHATNLKPPAAHMRYSRLRHQIEAGRLKGRHESSFDKASKRMARATNNRKRSSKIAGRRPAKGPTNDDTDTTKAIKLDSDVGFRECEGASFSYGSELEDDKPSAKRQLGDGSTEDRIAQGSLLQFL